jgi:hypothetical protein
MLYWLKVYALIATLVFAPTVLIIMSLFVWYEAKQRLSTLLTQPRFFAMPVVISRTFSRSLTRSRLIDHKIQ